MSENLKLGQIIDTEQHRDAIHVAVAPVVAGTLELQPGAHVGFLDDGTVGPECGLTTAIGVVDPFLRKPVRPGERFWLFLYPGTIKSLRHEWTHPAFSTVATPAIDAESRLREIAAACDMGYEMMMNAAEMWLEYGDYTTQQGQESWRDNFPQYAEEFWSLYEKLKGRDVRGDKRSNFFSCSC